MTIDVSRRIFLESMAGASLTLAIAGCGKIPKAPAMAQEVNAWLSIAADGVTTIRVNATEMGQGAQTGLAQIVGDEMDADWSKVRVEMAPVTKRFFVKDGSYFTGGSSSIGGEFNQFDAFAKAGAMARTMLVNAAAKRWHVDGADCTTESGTVTGPRGERASYGELVADALKEPVPVSVTLKEPAARRLVGKPVARLDIPEKVNGTSIYGIDVNLPGMLYAAIRHSPYQQGMLSHVDDGPARAMRGVKHVVRLVSAVAVVADRWWRARRAVDALKPVWRKPADAVVASDDAMFALMKGEIGAQDSLLATLTPNDPDRAAVAARVDAAFANAKDVFEREYQVPFLSHSPIEPLNATARMTAEGCELWASMQNQSGMQKEIARALNVPQENVVLNTTRVGGGFGRRLESDYGVEAALIARVTGAPVKLIWTREEDMTHDFYRPASSCRLKVALNDDLTFRAFDYSGATANDTAIGGIARNYGPVADTIVRQKTVQVPMTIGAWRSVDPSITIFFIESLVDEIAHDRKRDPLAYRRYLLANNSRGLRVLNAAAEMAQWGKTKPGRAQGIAFFNHAYWGTAVAEIVELSVDAQNKLTIHKVYCAIDPGTAVNPNAVEAQAQGGITLGLSAALGEAITLKDGQVEQTNFDQYAILRMAGAPDVEVKILESPDAAIGGCGEPPVPPSMPALGNAIFAATGKRIRSLPFSRSGFTV